MKKDSFLKNRKSFIVRLLRLSYQSCLKNEDFQGKFQDLGYFEYPRNWDKRWLSNEIFSGIPKSAKIQQFI